MYSLESGRESIVGCIVSRLGGKYYYCYFSLGESMSPRINY